MGSEHLNAGPYVCNTDPSLQSYKRVLLKKIMDHTTESENLETLRHPSASQFSFKRDSQAQMCIENLNMKPDLETYISLGKTCEQSGRMGI